MSITAVYNALFAFYSQKIAIVGAIQVSLCDLALHRRTLSMETHTMHLASPPSTPTNNGTLPTVPGVLLDESSDSSISLMGCHMSLNASPCAAGSPLRVSWTGQATSALRAKPAEPIPIPAALRADADDYVAVDAAPSFEFETLDTLCGASLSMSQSIGQGASSTVFRVAHATSGCAFAAKDLTLRCESTLAAARAELAVAECLHAAQRSSSLARVEAVVAHDSVIRLVMPLYTGSIEKWRRVPAAAAAAVGARVADGLATLHSLGFLHRDVKPSNVLYSRATGDIALSDFGLACPVELAASPTQNSFAGSLTYMSPERLRCAPHGPPSDMWSLGWLLVLLLSGRHPLRDAAHAAGSGQDARFWAVSAALRLGDHDESAAVGAATQAAVKRLVDDALDGVVIDAAFRALIEQLLAVDPSARPSAEAVRSVLVSIACSPAEVIRAFVAT